jgi:glutathione S-transferase
MQGEVFLQKLEGLLGQTRYLLAEHISMADIAIFPFIRQFSGVDSAWFETAPYPNLKTWLKGLIESELFVSIMEKQPTYLE